MLHACVDRQGCCSCSVYEQLQATVHPQLSAGAGMCVRRQLAAAAQLSVGACPLCVRVCAVLRLCV